jgi:hypothetical protein
MHKAWVQHHTAEEYDYKTQFFLGSPELKILMDEQILKETTI